MAQDDKSVDSKVSTDKGVVAWTPDERAGPSKAISDAVVSDVRAEYSDPSFGQSTTDLFRRAELPDELQLAAAKLILAPDTIAPQVRMLAADLSEMQSIDDVLSASFRGELVLPSGGPGAALAVSLRLRESEDAERDAPFEVPVALTNDAGRFSMALPTAPIPDEGLELRVQGGDTHTGVPVDRAMLRAGRLGTVTLDRPLAPLSSQAQVALGEDDLDERPSDTALGLGEEKCARRFASNAGVIDRYRWSTLIRLVEPRVVPPQGQTRGGASVPDPAATALDALLYRDGASRVGQRVPVGAPLDVDLFRRRMEQNPGDVPKAGSIGLGYILRMSQAWIPRGLSLGNLLYSLPLAPGEEQRVVVSESIERLTVRERERATLTEQQRQTDRIARTTSQLFGASLNEAASGGSAFESDGSSSQIGGGFSILGFGASGGGSWSSTSGSSSSWQRSSRDFASWAAESFHSNLSRRAALSRQVSSVSVRLATLEDRDEAASKIVANRNRNHALTLQYWEVMRNFTVTSDIDDVALVCFVPLEIIPWISLQSQDGPDGALPANITRSYLVDRYATILRHAIVLRRRLRFRPRLRRALDVVEELASNPMIEVNDEAETQRLSLRISSSGTFLPFDRLNAVVVTQSGRRIGPAALTPASAEEPVARQSINRGDLIDALLARREDISGAESTRAAHLVLPRSVSTADIARIEIRHRLTSWTYRPPDIDAQAPQDDSTIEVQLGARPRARTPISLSARVLTQSVGAPRVWDVAVESLAPDGETIAEDLVGVDNAVRMPARFIVTPEPEDPLFGREELQLAEELLTHLRENALRYSKAVWADLSPDELVMLLEPRTLGLPLADGTLSEVPLVSCIATSILGFFGNSMVLPFHVPPQMAVETGTTSAEIEEELTVFHRQSFRPPRTEISLSAGGMLGEAVLGACDSAEKIDLTRLWNWADAPLPQTADDPSKVAFADERLVGTGAAAAPNRLGKRAAPRYDIAPDALPKSALDLAKLITALPKSQLPSDLDASGLAEAFAASGLTNAAAIADQVVTKVMEANEATGPSAKDGLNMLKALEGRAGERKKQGLAALAGDPSVFVEQIGNAPEGEREGLAKQIAGDLTGGQGLGAAEKAGVFGSLKSFGGGLAGGSAKALGLKALMVALGLPPI